MWVILLVFILHKTRRAKERFWNIGTRGPFRTSDPRGNPYLAYCGRHPYRVPVDVQDDRAPADAGEQHKQQPCYTSHRYNVQGNFMHDPDVMISNGILNRLLSDAQV